MRALTYGRPPDCLRHGDLVIAAGLSKSISVTSLHTNEVPLNRLALACARTRFDASRLQTQHFPAHDHFVCSLEMAAPNVMAGERLREMDRCCCTLTSACQPLHMMPEYRCGECSCARVFATLRCLTRCKGM